MSGSIEAVAPTANASRYLQQLCKHWSHKMQVSFTATEGTIAFPNGTVATLSAGPDDLRIRLDVPPAEDSALMAGVVAEHLDRFAFREAPLSFDWRAL
jgi:hypothetical protein